MPAKKDVPLPEKLVKEEPVYHEELEEIKSDHLGKIVGLVIILIVGFILYNSATKIQTDIPVAESSQENPQGKDEHKANFTLDEKGFVEDIEAQYQ